MKFSYIVLRVKEMFRKYLSICILECTLYIRMTNDRNRFQIILEFQEYPRIGRIRIEMGHSVYI